MTLMTFAAQQITAYFNLRLIEELKGFFAEATTTIAIFVCEDELPKGSNGH
jgi:hypothetical protein